MAEGDSPAGDSKAVLDGLADQAKKLSEAIAAAKGSLEAIAPAPASAPAANAERWAAAIDRIRHTARWMLGVYAAIGLAFFGSLPFTDLDGLTWDDTRSWAAAAGAVLLAAGVSIAILSASEVFLPRVGAVTHVGPNQPLGRELDQKLDYERYELFQGMGDSIDDLAESWERLRAEYYSASLDALGEGKEGGPKTRYRDLVKSRFDEVDGATTYLAGLGAYYKLYEVFEWARRGFAVGALLVLTGAFMFFASVRSADAATDNEGSSAGAAAASTTPATGLPELPAYGQLTAAVAVPGQTATCATRDTGTTVIVIGGAGTVESPFNVLLPPNGSCDAVVVAAGGDVVFPVSFVSDAATDEDSEDENKDADEDDDEGKDDEDGKDEDDSNESACERIKEAWPLILALLGCFGWAIWHEGSKPERT